MSLHLSFRKLEVTDALKQLIEKKTAKFEKVITYPMEIHVTVSLEKTLHVCEIVCHAEHKDIVGIAKTDDLYESIDQAVIKIEKQIKKSRDRKKGHQAAHRLVRAPEKEVKKDVGANFPHEGKRVRAGSGGR